MKKCMALLLLSGTGALAESATALPAFEGRLRRLITQDGEVDDMNLLIHTLLCANEFDLESIVQSSSVLHYSGDGENASFHWMGTDWMYDFLDAYAEVCPNLTTTPPPIRCARSPLWATSWPRPTSPNPPRTPSSSRGAYSLFIEIGDVNPIAYQRVIVTVV